jgi:lantibiotic modifying enzyme
VVTSDAYRELGEAAWSWVLRHVCDDDGPWLPSVVAEDWRETGPSEFRDSLYEGIAGLSPALAEIAQHRELRDTEQELARAIVARLSAMARTRTEPSLYDGLAGDATALRMLDQGTESVALQRLHDLATPAGWNTSQQIDSGADAQFTDIIAGSAGIVLAGIWAGGEHAAATATTGGEALLQAADETPAGLDWGMLPHSTSRGPNYSHGTAGIAATLAIAGTALHRPDFVEAARRGAQHLLAVGSLDDDGFIVPHTIPPTTRVVEPVTYTWCHGPAGTSYLFAALSHAGVAEVDGIAVTELRQRCLNSILASGVPQRLRPGFWDNDGRCCGTAGVGEVLLDAVQDSTDPARAATLMDAGRTMGDALVERAIRDEEGARWRFLEHRQDPPLLPPGTSWMQGAAGIGAFLLRLTRVIEDGPGATVVDRPDQWWGVPAHVRSNTAIVRPTRAAPSTNP